MPVLLVLTLLAAIAARLLRGGNETEARLTVPVMGTLANITVVCDRDSVQALLHSIDSLLTGLDSELAPDGQGTAGTLNRTGRALLTPDFEAVLEFSRRMTAVTHGAFDPTIAPVVQLWGFHSGPPSVPDSASVDSALALSGWGGVSLRGDSVFLQPGRRIDFGAVVPGYAADRAFDLAMRGGASRALIETGGEIRCGGTGTWKIAVTHPREAGFWTILETGPCGLSTSGDYENFVEMDGLRFCHILDPSTGWSERGVVSVTVKAPASGLADALSTALAVRGPSLLDSIPDSLWTGALFIFESDSGLVERRFGTI